MALASLCLLTGMLAGCGQAASTSDTSQGGTKPSDSAASTEAATTRTFTDAMGHKVEIPANPQRVLAPYLEDHLTALGVKPVAQWSVENGTQDYLSQSLNDVPLIPFNLPLEQVAALNPDLIIITAESLVEKGLYDQYKAIAPTYVLGDKVNGDWRKALVKVGELLNKKDAAEQALKEYDAKAVESKEKLQKAIGEQSAAVLWLTNKNLFMVGKSMSSGAVLYKDLGMKAPKLVDEVQTIHNASWNSVSLEKLGELDADHIFLVNSDKGNSSDILNSPVWKSLPAVKAGHVYKMESKKSWLYTGKIANEAIIDDVLKVLVK